MPRYRYEGLKDGEWVEGFLKADSAIEAEQAGLEKGVYIETLIQTGRHKKLSQKELLQFTQGMNSLLKAGLPLKEAANLWTEDAKDPEFWNQLFSHVLAGKALSEEMEEHAFPPYLVAMTRIGETTGRLQESFDYCVLYLLEQRKLKQTLVSALTYPAMVLCVAFIAILILFLYVMPVFEEMYQRYDSQLPLITQWLMGSMSFIRANWISLLFVVVGIIAVLKQTSKTRRFREWRDQWILVFPGLSVFSKQYFDTLICQSLGNLLTSGVGILESMHILVPLVSSIPIQKRLQEATIWIAQGVSPAESFDKEKLFNKRIRRMIRVGEESGDLGDVLTQLGQIELETLQARLKSFTNVLEPLIIIGISIIIGVILTALYLPMFDIVQAMG